MNYITDTLDFSLLQFGPLTAITVEISYRRVWELVAHNPSCWLLPTDSDLKAQLTEKDLVAAFDSVQDTENLDLVGLNPEDQILIIVPTHDSHLTVAQLGFRFFHTTFKKEEIPCRLFIDGHEQEVVKITE